VLQEKGRLGKRVICKATIRAPGNNVHTRGQGDTVGIRPKLSDSGSIVVSHESHLDREAAVVTG
jgi:hypothetical protein